MSSKNSVESLASESTEPVKRKKGRPRKDQSKIVEGDHQIDVKVEEKKKRGRKKKEVVVEEVKPKKKRGRKAALKYFSSSIRKKIPLTTVIPDNGSYILHLDVKDECEKEKEVEVQESHVLFDPLNKIQENIEDELMGQSGNEELAPYKIKAQKKGGNLKDDECDVSDSKQHTQHELERELKEMFENDQSILSDFLDKNTGDLRELYEQRIQARAERDRQFIQKLEDIHNDDVFVNTVLMNNLTNKNQKVITKYVGRKDQETNRKKGYFELLSEFVENDDWLHKTDVACWWCCHRFDGVPIGRPVDYNDKIKKFRVKGIFCSFPCMIAYNGDLKTNGSSKHLVNYLYFKVTGGQFNSKCAAQQAPPRCSLRMFGGDLTIEEFRGAAQQHKIYKMVEYPMFVSKDYVEEVDVANVKKANISIFKDDSQSKNIVLDEKRVQEAKARQAKIDKHSVSNGNTIEKFITFS